MLKPLKDVANSEGGTALRVLSQSNVTLGTKTRTVSYWVLLQAKKFVWKKLILEYYKNPWMTTAFGPAENQNMR